MANSVSDFDQTNVDNIWTEILQKLALVSTPVNSIMVRVSVETELIINQGYMKHQIQEINMSDIYYYKSPKKHLEANRRFRLCRG